MELCVRCDPGTASADVHKWSGRRSVTFDSVLEQCKWCLEGVQESSQVRPCKIVRQSSHADVEARSRRLESVDKRSRRVKQDEQGLTCYRRHFAIMQLEPGATATSHDDNEGPPRHRPFGVTALLPASWQHLSCSCIACHTLQKA